MKWLWRLVDAYWDWRNGHQEPDSGYPGYESSPPIPEDFAPSTTQPIRDPGALDTLPGRLQ